MTSIQGNTIDIVAENSINITGFIDGVNV
ncbi:MAG: hypothetical protein EZS28_049391, partial [Streblomastix strix]